MTPPSEFRFDSARAGDRATAWERSSGLLLLAAAYVLINVWLAPGGFVPVHQDDYHVLGAGFDRMRFMVERPVSSNLAYAMGGLGAGVAFAVLNTMTVLVAFGALAFLARLFSLRIRWYAMLVFAAIAFNDPSAYEHGRYLGLVTNLTSHAFGLATLWLLLESARARSFRWGAAALGAFALSALAKEDFLLPPLLLAAFLWFQGVTKVPGVRGSDLAVRVFLLAGILAVIVLSLWFNLSLGTPFLAGLTDGVGEQAHYAVGMGPGVLVASLAKLTVGYVPVALTMGAAGMAVAWVLLPGHRREIVLVVAIVLGLILPYALLPNNSPQYRVFAWLPWLAGSAAIGCQLLVERLPAGPAPLRGRAELLVLIAAASLLWGMREPRLMVARWYAEVQGVNARFAATIDRHRETIIRRSRMGIVGIEGLSPWSNNNGEYVRRRTGYGGAWIVFVKGDSPMYAMEPANPGDPRAVPREDHVFVQPLGALCHWTGLDVLVFDEKGNGVLRKAGDLCAGMPGAGASMQRRGGLD